MSRTGTVAVVAVGAPLGAVLAMTAIALAAWAEHCYNRSRQLRRPWNLA